MNPANDKDDYNYEPKDWLTDRAKLFVGYYLMNQRDLHGALKKAGFDAPEDQLAIIGQSIIQRPIIKRYINKKIAMHMERLDITVQRIINEISCIAFCDISEFFDQHGKIKPIHEMPETARRALSSIDLEQILNGGSRTTTFKAKTHSKEKALELLGKYMGLFKESVNVNHIGEVTHNVKKIDLEERIAQLEKEKLNGLLE